MSQHEIDRRNQPSKIDEFYASPRYWIWLVISVITMLRAAGAEGGPESLSRRSFVFGINDPLGCDANGANCDPSRARFDPIVFTEFDAWAGASGDGRNRARASVVRGQQLFNTVPIRITGVSGNNDDFDLPTVTGTCTRPPARSRW